MWSNRYIYFLHYTFLHSSVNIIVLHHQFLQLVSIRLKSLGGLQLTVSTQFRRTQCIPLFQYAWKRIDIYRVLPILCR